MIKKYLIFALSCLFLTGLTVEAASPVITRFIATGGVINIPGHATDVWSYQNLPGYSGPDCSITAGASAIVCTPLSTKIDNTFGSAQGSILYRGASNWMVLAPGTAGTVLVTGGAGANPQWLAAASVTTPKPQWTLIGPGTGSGTYTVPTGATRLEIEGAAAGQGGSGGGSGPPAGTNGGDLTFGPLTIPGGGSSTSASLGGVLGTYEQGGRGGGLMQGGGSNTTGGAGGTNRFGGAGYAGGPGASNVATAGVAGTGAGGGGGGSDNNIGRYGGPGGQAGTSFDVIITNLASSYSYSIGAPGTGGVGSVSTGGNGGSGKIIVKAYFN